MLALKSTRPELSIMLTRNELRRPRFQMILKPNFIKKNKR